MKYERLTKRDEEYGIITLCDSCSWTKKGQPCTSAEMEHGETVKCIDEVYDRLAKLEDKIERGELQEIPDGAVVIDKGELEALRNDLINAECNLNHVTLQLEEESKRVASAIYEKAKAKQYFERDCMVVDIDDLKEICEVDE